MKRLAAGCVKRIRLAAGWRLAALLLVLPATALLLVPLLGTSPGPAGGAAQTGRDGDGRVRLHLSDRLADLRIDQGAVVVRTEDGPRTLSPQQFVDALAEHQRSGRQRGPVYRVLDITTPLGLLWVGIGFLGQILFTGRMVVQWLVSERAGQSIVPPIFWWMSLGGASMLLAYFTWRIDIVGVIGQLTGWLIYARNLWLLYRHTPGEQVVVT